MSSGIWGPGSPAGDEGTAGRGTVGTVAAATPPAPRPRPIGSVRPLIAAAALMLALLCVALAFVAGLANGLLVLATTFAAVHVWAVGGFRREFWVHVFWKDANE